MSSTPVAPPISLGLQLKVTNGHNQIQRNIGSYAALYLVPGSRTVENYLELAPGDVYNSNPGEATNNLVLNTNAALTFKGTRTAGGVLTMVVNRLLAMDDSLSSWSITNNSTGPARVNLNAVNFTTLAPVPGVYYGAALLPGAFNETFILSLQKSADSNKDQVVTMTAGPAEYLYYCYPTVLGLANFEVNGFSGGLTLVGIATVTTPIGPLQYYVYQSDNPDLGVVTLTVTEG